MAKVELRNSIDFNKLSKDGAERHHYSMFNVGRLICRRQTSACSPLASSMFILSVFDVVRSSLFNFQGFGFFYFLGEEVQIGRFFDDIHGAELDGLDALFLRYVARQQDD